MAAPFNNIDSLVRTLNTAAYSAYNSPAAGVQVSLNGTPYNRLTQGARLLTSLADSLHDLNHTKTIAGLAHTGPGVLTLKAWCRNLISRLPPNGPTTQGWNPVYVATMVNIIYTDPEEFVQRYLYYNDMFYYTNYQYIRESLPLAPETQLTAAFVQAGIVNESVKQSPNTGAYPRAYRFLLLNYPQQGKHDSKVPNLASHKAAVNYSKLSASILYKIYEKLFAESNWDMTMGLPQDVNGTTYPPFIKGTDKKYYRSIWYSRDQMAPNKIFNEYDCQKNIVPPHFDGLTNWYMWVGYAAQYDRVDLIASNDAAKLYCQKAVPPHHPDNCDFSNNKRDHGSLVVNLADEEAMLGIGNMRLEANTFLWTSRTNTANTIPYDLPKREQIKNHLANAIGNVDQAAEHGDPNLFRYLFNKLQSFAEMIDELCPNICRKTVSGKIVGLDFANGSGVSQLFQNGVSHNSGILYDDASRRYDAMSLFTDFKRVGDYLQAKEVHELTYLNNMCMPLLTHDAILATISHKIFSNHTVWFKPQQTNRSATYIVMIPQQNPENVSLRINKTANANSKLPPAAQYDASLSHGLREPPDAIPIHEFINTINASYQGPLTHKMWGGNRQIGSGRGSGKGQGRGSRGTILDSYRPDLYVDTDSLFGNSFMPDLSPAMSRSGRSNFPDQARPSQYDLGPDTDMDTEAPSQPDTPAMNTRRKRKLEEDDILPLFESSRIKRREKLQKPQYIGMELPQVTPDKLKINYVARVAYFDEPEKGPSYYKWMYRVAQYLYINSSPENNWRDKCFEIVQEIAQKEMRMGEEEDWNDLAEFFIGYYTIIFEEVLQGLEDRTIYYGDKDWGDTMMGSSESLASAAIMHTHLLYAFQENLYNDDDNYTRKEKSTQKRKNEKQKKRKENQKEKEKKRKRDKIKYNDIKTEAEQNQRDTQILLLLQEKIEPYIAEIVSTYQNLPFEVVELAQNILIEVGTRELGQELAEEVLRRKLDDKKNLLIEIIKILEDYLIEPGTGVEQAQNLLTQALIQVMNSVAKQIVIQELTEAVVKNLDLRTREFKTFIEKAIKNAMTEVKEFSKQAIIYNYSDKRIIQMEEQGEAPENIEDKVGKECQELLKVDVSEEIEAQIFQQVIESTEQLVLELNAKPNEQKLEFLKQQGGGGLFF